MRTADARRRLKQRIVEHCFKTAELASIWNKDGTLRNGGWIFDIKQELLSPEFLEDVAILFWDTFSGNSPIRVGGMESAAIPVVTALVMNSRTRTKRECRGFFIRKSRNKQGLAKHIEGEAGGGEIVLVDDLLNSGKSIEKQIAVLEEEGYKVSAVWALVRFREESYYHTLRERGISLHSVFTLDDFNAELGLSLMKESSPPTARTYAVLWHVAPKTREYTLTSPKSTPLLVDGRVYVGSPSGTFLCLNASDGSVMWSKDIIAGRRGKGIVSSPVYAEGLVVFGAYDGNVYALDAESGAVRWIYFDADWIGSSPAYSQRLGLIFVGLEFGLWRKHGGVAALDVKTGKAQWIYKEMPCFTHASPLYLPDSDEVAIGSNDGAVYLFAARDGSLKWKSAIGTPSEEELRSGFSGYDIKERLCYDKETDSLFGGTMSGTLFTLERISGKAKTLLTADFGIWATPLCIGDSLFAASLDKHLYCLDKKTGGLKWKWYASARIFSSPVVIGDSVYVGSNTGRLTELHSQTGKELSYITFSERITNPLVFDEETSTALVTSAAGDIYRIATTPALNEPSPKGA